MPAWAWAGVIGFSQVIFVGLLVALRKSDERRIENIEKWTKDKERFDYQFRHDEYQTTIAKIYVALYPVIEKVETLEENVKELREWKHDVVDPYIPRAVDEHERRINRLDSKVFNGHK